MEVRTFLRALGQYLFAEMLCLFLALTLSALGGTLWRIVSCICTFGVMLCIYVNFGIKRANEDRICHEKDTMKRRFFLSFSATIPFLIVGLLLILARAGLFPEGYYRFYKLLDAPFLQLCNFFCSDTSALALSWGRTIVLVLFNFVPFLAVWISYFVTRKEISFAALQYKK